MKALKREITSGPIVVKISPLLDDVKTEGAFKEKVDKANQILKTVGIPKRQKG